MTEIQIEPLGSRIADAVTRHVHEASVCVPVICDAHFDTHLLLAYCHKLCDESLREPIVVKVVAVDRTSATLARVQIDYNQSASFSLKGLFHQPEFRGVCFVWTERWDDPRGFRLQHKRLAPIFHTFYRKQTLSGERLDCLHPSPSRSSYAKERIFWVPQDGAEVTGIVCAPLEAYQHKAARLPYTFGIREEDGAWRHVKKEFPFTPSLWVNLGELFETEFKTTSTYTYSVKGPKGKGWLLTETAEDFNLHHL